MNSTRIRIDLGHGIIEAEGTEDFVRSIYEDFKSRLESGRPHRTTEESQKQVKRDTQQTDSQSMKRKKGGASSSTPSIVKDLDLSGGGKIKGLRDYYSTFKPSSNFERNLIFVYYLTQLLGMTGITVDRVFTCYRNITGLKAPTNTYQSLIDTNRRKAWIDTSSTNDIKVTVQGINYLEYDMPKPESE